MPPNSPAPPLAPGDAILFRQALIRHGPIPATVLQILPDGTVRLHLHDTNPAIWIIPPFHPLRRR